MDTANKFVYKIILLFMAIMLLLFASCSSDASKSGSSFSDLFSTQLSEEKVKAALARELALHADTSNMVHMQLSKLYAAAEDNAIWIKNSKLSDKGTAMLASIAKLKDDGLDPERYQYAYLAKAFSVKIDNEDSLAALDIALSKNAALAAKDLMFGILKPQGMDTEWHASNDSAFSVVDVFNKDFDDEKDPLDIFRPQNPRYSLLRKDLAKWTALQTDSAFQQLQKNIAQNSGSSAIHQLIKMQINSSASDSALVREYKYLNNAAANGKEDAELTALLQRKPAYYIAQLKMNLERLRWLPNTWKPQYIWVSIPQAEVDYFVANKNSFHRPTIVGSKSNRTPSLLKPLQNIVICPPWNLPPSIVKHDYNGRIPGKYQVYRGGKRVPNSMVNAANYRSFNIRQPAGPSAALGYVKFNLPNEWNIYLHDTPNRSLFGNRKRTLSHGCVRVQDPQQLAALILEDKGVSVDSISKIIAKNQTTAISTDLIPVYIVYMTVGADASLTNPIFLNDPYGKDSVLLAKMALK